MPLGSQAPIFLCHPKRYIFFPHATTLSSVSLLTQMLDERARGRELASCFFSLH